MARRLRVEYAGAIYHVMSRGDRRERIFEDADDRYMFLKTLSQACEKTCWQVHAYCLMDNHFHLVIETPQPNLVVGMKWLLGTFTGRYNRRHRMSGHLFSGRYKALAVDGNESGYLRTVCDYVHLNPIRTKLLAPEQKLREYRWSSVPEYLKEPAHRMRWLRVDRLLGELGIPKDSAAGRRRFEEMIERRRGEDLAGQFADVRGGWCVGSEEFRRELLSQMAQAIQPNHYGAERQQSAEHRGEQIIKTELKRLGLIRRGLGHVAQRGPAQSKNRRCAARPNHPSPEMDSGSLADGQPELRQLPVVPVPKQ